MISNFAVILPSSAVGSHLLRYDDPSRLALPPSTHLVFKVFNDLISRFPAASVDMIHRSSALVPADYSSFVNSRAFDPSMTDEFNRLPLSDRLQRLQEFKRANYTCIAPEVAHAPVLSPFALTQNITAAREHVQDDVPPARAV